MNKWQIESNAAVKSAQDLTKVLLENRGLKTKKEIEEFLNPSFSKISSSYVGIDTKNLKKSVERIKKAIKEKENIIIFGDYDVDGICASAILWESLNSLKANVLPYIPSRLDEGYGLSVKGIDNLLEKQKVDLIVTVDNGIVALDAVTYANSKGIDVIITDHHVASTKLPNAYSIVHTISLCGAGVAYLFSKEIKNEKPSEKDDHLELVVLATIADLVPLLNANRDLVYFGIKKLRETKRPGLLALINKSKVEKENIGIYEIGHIIAPRLNAAGRLADAMNSLRLICTKDIKKAEKLADILNKINFDRQQITIDSLNHAITNVKKKELKNLIFIADKSYQQGIVGLVAGRLVEEFYLPSIVISKGEKLSRASARSVKGFNIIEFLRQAQDLLVDVGGHPMAAGFTVETKNIEALEKKLFENALKLVKKEHLERVLRIDSKLPQEFINMDTYNLTAQFSPFGMANPEPTFLGENLFVENLRLVGRDGKHLKLDLRNKNSDLRFQGIYFGSGENNKFSVGDRVDVVFTLDENEWNGRKNLQLKIKDLRKN